MTLADLQTSQSHLRLFINQGKRRFTEETAERFDVAGHDQSWLDFSFLQDIDDDGDLDILADEWGRLLSWLNEDGIFVKQP